MTSPARHESGRIAPAPRTAELGHGHATSDYWSHLGEEATPELIWPNSIAVFDRMRRQDAQVRSVLRAVTLPVVQTAWRLHPGDAPDAVVRFVAENLGLPIVGQTDAPPSAVRERDRFSFRQHLRWALLCTAYGHMFFEQVYRYDESGGRFHLRKLAPRWPKTIHKIETADDGGLVAIYQRPLAGRKDTRGRVITEVPIPVTSLVAYVHEQEGGNWLGQSLLRPAYKHWLLKDEGLRTWAQTINRNGMGVPHYTAGEDEDSLDAGLALAQTYRSGPNAGGAGPYGSRMELLGVMGALPDIDAFVRYQDQQIATSVLAHFMNLGQATGTGSYALGASFMDFFIMSLQSLADLMADTMTQHVVEDLVDANFGENAVAPRVVYDPIGQNMGAVVQAVQMLIASGAIFPDPALDAFVRNLVGLPPKAPLPNPQTPAGAAPPPQGTPGGDKPAADQ